MQEERRTIPSRREEDFKLCPRYDRHEISEDQVIEIAKKAIILAKEEFYMDVGKSVTSKFFILIGVLSTIVTTWLVHKGYLK